MARPAACVVLLGALLAPRAREMSAQAPIRGYPADALARVTQLDRQARDAVDTARVHRYIREMTRVPHAVGTPGSKRVAEWILKQFTSWGLDAKIETYEAMIPLPLEQVLEIRGPKPWRAQLKEEVFAEDPDSKLPGILPPYASGAVDGDVTGQLVYANYALAADLDQLARMGVDVKGKIVLARAGPHGRAIKAKLAAQHGAIGLIVYNDPKEDGFWLGRPYPRGPMRPPQSMERGGIRGEAEATGDMLSPGWASKPGSRRLPLAEARGLTTIPVLFISYGDATPLFEALQGPVVPSDAWKGALGVAYLVGPSAVKVRMKVRSEWKTRPIYNVIAKIPGATHPDQWIIAGNHHDAWVYGADDPVGAAATVMEAARSLAALQKTGWRPDRTLIFAMWDGEEIGLLGSTEWAEDHADELRQKAVAYIQGDNYRRGNFTSSGSTALETFMREVARDTRDPLTGRSVLDLNTERQLSAARNGGDSAAVRERPFALTPIAANTDYGAFIQHLGISSLHIAYRNTGRGTYHSAFDSYRYFKRFLDPDFSYGKSQAGAFASALLRMSDAPVLPWCFTDAARAYRGWGQEVATLARTSNSGVDVAPLTRAIDSLHAASTRYDRSLDRVMQAGSALLQRNTVSLAGINRDIYQSEQTLLFENGLPGRAWWKYPISGPSTYNGMIVRTFPVIRDAIEQRDATIARAQMEATAAAVLRLTQRVQGLADRLDALR